MIAGIKRLLNLHEDKMGWYEKNSWLITLSRKYLEMNNSDGFKETFNKIDKGRFKLLKMFLTLSNGIGSNDIGLDRGQLGLIENWKVL